MKKIIILVVVLVLISIGLVSCFYINNRNKENKLLNQKETSNEVIKDLNEEEEDIENESISEDIKNDNDDNKNISNNDVNTNKSNMESNSSSNSNVINNKQENKNVTQVKEEKHEPENKPVVQEPTPEPPKKEQTPWESLGISEYDYYNKPMWSWARIDYSVKVYGTLEQTHQACIDDGNKLEDIISFSCDNINSYSGDYLGDMLRVKK